MDSASQIDAMYVRCSFRSLEAKIKEKFPGAPLTFASYATPTATG